MRCAYSQANITTVATTWTQFTYDAIRPQFTGKERDTESGNDYFEARYYSSAMGRFMSPDWSAKEEPVPYAKLDDPQTLNLYVYVGNNPMTRVDADGHEGPPLSEDTVNGIGAFFQKASDAISNFATAHPQLTEDIKQLGVMYLTDGLARGGGKIEMPVEEGIPFAPSMKAAQREVMKQEGIPTSQQPASQKSTEAGKQYTYEVPKPGGGTETKVVQRNTGTDRSHPGQPHVEGGRPKSGGQTDSLGRPRLQNDKTKVNVVKPNGQ